MVAELQPEDPRTVGRYQLLGRLGSGGMGFVYLGRSPGGRYVAVKVIKAELAGQADFRIRFAREVAAARTVSGLFTAPVVDADVDAPTPWLATAYVPGLSLSDAVARYGPLPISSVFALAAGLAEGLEAIHAAGIVHRDLKPSNVLLAEDGPRVIDFGISRAAEESPLTGTGLIIGSPGFMSPEQAQGHSVGLPSDVFSLGAVLVFAATGAGPFGPGSNATLLYRVVFAAPATGNVPAELRPLVERCLAKDPRQRPSAAQLLSEVNTHPTPGWLPAPITQGFSSPIPSDPALSTPPAKAGAPWPAGPTTVTAGAGRPDALTQPRPPGGTIPGPGYGRRRRAVWGLVAAGVLAVVTGTAVAVASTLGAPPHQLVAQSHTASPARSSPVSAVPLTQPATSAGTSSSAQTPSRSSSSSVPPAVSSGVFWTAAVLSSHYEQDAQRMVQRLEQSGFSGEYWYSTADNSVLPGYWVVTSGRFPDRADAAARATQLQAAGFTGTYARCVGPRQDCSS
jgi:eukaryotic-like serine/threonine-protein kinase